MTLLCCSAPSPSSSGDVCQSCGSQLPGVNMHMRCDPVPQVHMDQFIPDTRVKVGHVPEDVVGHFVRQTIIDFAHRTGILRRHAWLDAAPDVFSYSLRFGDCYQLGAITRVEAGPVCLTAINNVPCGDRCARGKWFHFDMPDTLYIGWPPLAADSPTAWIEVDASVIPGQDSCQVDRIVFDRYAEVIANGAASRILVMQDEEWSNGNLALHHERRYLEGVARATRERHRGFSEQQVTRQSFMQGHRGFMP